MHWYCGYFWWLIAVQSAESQQQCICNSKKWYILIVFFVSVAWEKNICIWCVLHALLYFCFVLFVLCKSVFFLNVLCDTSYICTKWKYTQLEVFCITAFLRGMATVPSYSRSLHQQQNCMHCVWLSVWNQTLKKPISSVQKTCWACCRASKGQIWSHWCRACCLHLALSCLRPPLLHSPLLLTLWVPQEQTAVLSFLHQLQPT